MTELTAARVMEILAPIPEEDFLEGEFTDGKSKCCVIGHWMRLHSKNPQDYSEENCSDLLKYPYQYSDLRVWSKKVSLEIGIPDDIVWVNNERGYYEEPTSKQRVMAYLEDALKAGF